MVKKKFFVRLDNFSYIENLIFYYSFRVPMRTIQYVSNVEVKYVKNLNLKMKIPIFNIMCGYRSVLTCTKIFRFSR